LLCSAMADGRKGARHHEANAPGLKVHALSSANSIRHES
jgi:hypothetical protein